MKRCILLITLILLSFNNVNAKTNVPKIVNVQHYTDKIHVTFMLKNNEKKIVIESFDDEEIINTAGYAFSIFQGVSDSEICLESHHGNAYKEYNIMCYTYDISENDWIHTHDMVGTYYELSNTGDYKIKDKFIYYKSDAHEGLYNANKNYSSDKFLANSKEIKNFLQTKLQSKENILINPINLVKCIKIFPINNENLSIYEDLAFYLQQAKSNDESKYILEQIKKFKDANINSKIIQSKKQPLYKTPSEKTKMYLIKGDKVEILEEKDDWLYILYHGKKDIKAWIPKSAIEETEINQEIKPVSKNIEIKEEKTFFTKLLEFFNISKINQNTKIIQS